MKIAVATQNHWTQVSGHAGQTRDWLVFDCQPNMPLPTAQRVVLTKEQLPHHFQDDGPHPLHGVDILIAASAGDGFVTSRPATLTSCAKSLKPLACR